MANGIRVDTRQLKAFRGRLEKLEKFEFGRISRRRTNLQTGSVGKPKKGRLSIQEP